MIWGYPYSRTPPNEGIGTKRSAPPQDGSALHRASASCGLPPPSKLRWWAGSHLRTAKKIQRNKIKMTKIDFKKWDQMSNLRMQLSKPWALGYGRIFLQSNSPALHPCSFGSPKLLANGWLSLDAQSAWFRTLTKESTETASRETPCTWRNSLKVNPKQVQKLEWVKGLCFRHLQWQRGAGGKTSGQAIWAWTPTSTRYACGFLWTRMVNACVSSNFQRRANMTTSSRANLETSRDSVALSCGRLGTLLQFHEAWSAKSLSLKSHITRLRMTRFRGM